MALKKKDTPHITPEEYLQRERASLDEKHEYVDGEIFAMVGASRAHMLIELSVASLLREQLKNKRCCPYGSNLKVVAGNKEAFYYPDVTVVCGNLNYLDGEKDVVTNPSVVIEVLSHRPASMTVAKNSFAISKYHR